jgi:1-aminocyclopropane-1-carboxylate synthase
VERTFGLCYSVLRNYFAFRNPSIKLIISSHNPTGKLFSLETINQVIDWCLSKNINLIADEIYALSEHLAEGEKSRFTSVGSVRPEVALHENIHLIWGFSKDFSMSGARVGVLYTENKKVYDSIMQIAYWYSVSGFTQRTLDNMLNDKLLFDYLSSNSKALKASCRIATDFFKSKMGAPCILSESGFFIFVFLGKYLNSNTFQAENELWRYLIDKCRVNLTPGSACFCSDPGWFRVCFAAQPLEKLQEALDRISLALDSITMD